MPLKIEDFQRLKEFIRENDKISEIYYDIKRVARSPNPEECIRQILIKFKGLDMYDIKEKHHNLVINFLTQAENLLKRQRRLIETELNDL